MAIITLLTFFVAIVALLILIHLVETRDGNLRKILIGYFLVEVFIYGVCVYFEIKLTFPPLYQQIALTFLIPKSIIKLIFYRYISKRNGGNLSNHH